MPIISRGVRRCLFLFTVWILLGVPLGAGVRAADGYQLTEGRLLPRVLKLISQHYVAPEMIEPGKMLKGALDEIQRGVPEIVSAWNDGSVTLTVDLASRRFAIPEVHGLTDIWDPLKEIFAFIDVNYHGEIKAAEMEYLAIEGLLRTIDPHSNLFRPKEYREFRIGTKGDFGGIGIVIGTRDGTLSVIAPIDGTPAARAGLKAQDKIMQIGEDSTINMSLTEAVERLRGKVGTSIALNVERAGRPTFTVTLKRAIIRIDSVQSKLLTENGKQIGYLKVKSFQENTMEDFHKQLAALHTQAGGTLDGLILDLRNNPGGLLQEAVEMSDTFLADGVIVSTVGARGLFLDRSTATEADTEPPYPLVLLINEGSASASEIVSGALQANHRALVVGARSFGKGSVQTIYDLRDGSALKLTIAEYLTAGENSIQEIGITPDVALMSTTIDLKHMNLLPDKFYSESDLEKHLKKRALTQSESAFHVPFLQKSEEIDPDDEEKSSKEYSTELKLDDDFFVQFSRRVLANLTPTEEDEWPGLSGLVQTVGQEEDARVSKALAGVGVDWSASGAVAAPAQQLQVNYRLRKGKQVVDTLIPGEEYDMVLTVRNLGKTTIYRLIGQTTSEVALMANKEFVFGKLNPGEERSASIPLKADKQVLTEHMPVTIELSDDSKKTREKFSALIPVRGLPHPQFAFNYQLGAPRGTTVKDSAPLPRGKSIPLTVQVKNVGDGAALQAIVAISNVDKGPYLEVGRVTLGELAPGQTKTATLKFHIDGGFDAGNFKIELSVVDAKLLESLSAKLDVTIGTGRTTPEPGAWYQAPTVHVATDHWIGVTSAANETIKGTITDDGQVHDVMVFVGERKVFYRSNPSPLQTLDIVANLPLKPGNNLITIAARDNFDLMGRRAFTMYRNDTTAWKTIQAGFK